MKKTHKILLAALIVCLVAVFGFYWAASHHIIRTDRGTIVLNKRFLTTRDTFVDLREWTASDLDRHPDVKRALVNQGYRDLVAEKGARELRGAIEDIADQVQRGLEAVEDVIEERLDRPTPVEK